MSLQPDDTPTPKPQDKTIGVEYRRQLLLLNRERIEFAYENAKANGLDDPVIVVLDLQDDRAASVARATGVSWEQIEQWREECGRCDVVPTQVLAAPRRAVQCVVGPTSLDSPQGFAKASPADTFRVVAIAAGGNAFLDFPLPPHSSFDYR
jgi:hypothetical protein